MEWFIWRLVTDKRIRANLRDLDEVWSMDDASDAHAVLDELDRAAHTLRTR